MKRKLIIAIALSAVILVVSLFTSSSMGQNLPRAKVDGGTIEGTIEGGIAVYKGIPFAAPPVGELRWKAPQPVVPWDGVRKCDAFGPSPVQGKPVPFMFWTKEFLIPAEPISEDCLYLNVWAPAKVSDEKLPVIVYIYGGGFRRRERLCHL